MTVRLFGVRHHGPGSARSLRVALESWRPDAVLVEGPPEAEAVLGLAADAALRPPVALLVYVPDDPGRAAFYPLAVFSPEWQALTFALGAGVPVRLVDLPAGAALAGEEDEEDGDPVRADPLAALAAAAGYGDPERWWEDLVELRGGAGSFDAVAEAMAALREDEEPAPREARREAAMREGIRAATKEGFARIAVVCGAWHVPALAQMPSAAADKRLLAGMPRRKVAATWVPWTHARLAAGSGYRAGVAAPGWYQHLFTVEDDVVTRWVVRVAALLRGEDLDAPPAGVIEAVRLAEALAAVRGRPKPGLDEVTDAVRAVLAGGADAPLALVWRRLVVGEEMGEVPDDAPAVPLARDLDREQRRLRLRPQPGERALELDLRKPTDRERSALLHRLRLLDVPWGAPRESGRTTGTFKEAWTLRWEPELAIRLIEASPWGTTVADAASARATSLAEQAPALGTVTGLLEAGLLAALPAAVDRIVGLLGTRAAVDTDVGHLMDALPPLARVLRYGDVRDTPTDAVRAVVGGLVPRVCAGLPVAVASLDDDAAAAAVARIDGVHAALQSLGDRDAWLAALGHVAGQRGVHGLVAGRCTRLLLDAGVLDAGGAARRLSAALSVGTDPAEGAAWVEGFLAGSGLLLLHDDALLGVVDGWLAGVPAAAFEALLPLLRRTFATFPAAERRQIGARVRSPRRRAAAAEEAALDVGRAEAVLPTVARLLGIEEAAG